MMSGEAKCMLVYGLDVVEMMKLQQAKVKLIRITDDMTKMKVRDIIDGSTEKVASEKEIGNDKFLILNNLSGIQLDMVMQISKRILKKKPIIATVTPTSIEWEFDYLTEHLMEEREWHKTNKGSVALHEQE